MNLTPEQSVMLATCIQLGVAWTVSPETSTHELLRSFEREGWAAEIECPLAPLIAYRITEAGKAALTRASTH